MKGRGIIISLGLAIAIVLVVASSAAATTITSPTGTVATPTIKAESEGHIVLHNDLADIECASTIEGKVESHGAGVTAKGNISALSFTGCTNNWVVHVNTPGSLEVHWTSGYNGTVTSSGMRITATRFGVSCIYETHNTHIGSITGGTPATLHISASIPRVGGNFACGGSTAQLTGSYKVTSPAALLIDNSAVSVGGTTITSPTGTVATPTIKAEGEGHAELHNAIVNIKCASAVEGKVENDGEDASASGNLSALSFTECTDGWVVEVVSPGELAVDWTGGYNGTVTSNGATVVATRSGLSCNYRTERTKIGTITGGVPATLDLEASIPRHGGSFLCGGSTAKWTGSYKVTDPSSLFVDRAGTVVTSPTGTTAAPTIAAESEGHVTLDHPFVGIQCQWAFEGTAEYQPEKAVLVPLSSLTISGCTDSWHATTVTPGTLKIIAASGYDGTVTWSGGTVELTRFGTTCRYKSDETHFGTLTGGTPATVHIEAELPFHGGSPLCGEEAYPLTGGFEVSGPSSLFVDTLD